MIRLSSAGSRAEARPEIAEAAARARAQEEVGADVRTYYQSRAPRTRGQGDLPLGRDGGSAEVLPATDAEGRQLVAKFVAGVRSPGGPSVGFTDEEVVAVAFALADKVSVTSRLPKSTRGANKMGFSPSTRQLVENSILINDKLTQRKRFRSAKAFNAWLAQSREADDLSTVLTAAASSSR